MNIIISDLVIAYRKAKVDAFYETGHLTAHIFAEYEENFVENLQFLLRKIESKDFEWFESKHFIGTHRVTIKKVDFDDRKDSQVKPKDEPFMFFSNSKRKWNQHETVETDFRIIGNHSVDFHILSALWIDKVGIYLEEGVSNNSYGCRLKRVGQKNGVFVPEDRQVADINHVRFFNGYFRQYLTDYQRWQFNGIEIIRKAIADDKKVVAVTADLKKYYHRIECSFLYDKEFLRLVGHPRYSSEQIALNDLLLCAINKWSLNVYNDAKVPVDFKYAGHSGIPMGLGASKIIANLLLIYLDREIENEIKPLYYGRYVDDLFIVLEDGGNIDCSNKFWEFLLKRIDNLHRPQSKRKKAAPDLNGEYDSDGYTLKVPFSSRSLLEFGKGKEKYFFLEGISGDSFLTSLQESLEENSSEWKLPPNSERDIESYSEEVARASSDHGENANGLRKSDGVSIQRLKFILYITRFEKSVNLLPKKVWSSKLDEFLDLAIEYTIRPENLAVYSKYYSRIMSLAVKGGKYDKGIDIISQVRYSYDKLIELSKGEIVSKRRGAQSNESKCLNDALNYQLELICEGVYSTISPFSEKGYTNQLLKIFEMLGETSVSMNLKARKLFIADLHKIPFKEIFITQHKRRTIYKNLNHINVFQEITIGSEELPNYDTFKRFSEEVWDTVIPTGEEFSFKPMGFYFYTRAFSLLELTLMFPSWHNIPKRFSRYCGLFNIEWVNPEFPNLPRDVEKDDLKIISLNSCSDSLDRIFAFTSLETSDTSWIANVREDGLEPDIRRDQRILDLVGNVIKCKARNKEKPISYVLFPELAIPRRLLLYISSVLLRSKISLIAGVEYENIASKKNIPTGFNGFVSNQLIYILCVPASNSLHHVSIIQEKVIPAQKEEAELFNAGGKILKARDETKFIINHGGLWFSGLICNDLLNIDNRAILRGLIDALIVIEWNKDVDTYDFLVSSTANDLHTFVLQINNRQYGDTRLRGPYKEPHERDKVRVRGGELDYFVVATLEVEKLREFQRNHRSPEKPFKPLPTGYLMSNQRKHKQ